MTTPVKSALSELPSRLRAAGYEPEALGPILKRGVLDFTLDLLPALIRRCREADSPAARLTHFFLLMEPLPARELQALLGTEAVHELQQRTLVEKEGKQLRARFSLTPLMGGYFFSDPPLRPGPVPWLAPAEYALALATPRARVEHAADLTAGCGAQAILNSTHSRSAWGRYTGLDDRTCSELNAEMNESGCRFAGPEQEIPGTFDLITARLPYVPPSWGEPSLLVRELAQRLNPRGTIALAMRHFAPDQPLLDRVQAWLGEGSWGLAELSYASRPLGLGDVRIDLPGLQAGFDMALESLVFIRKLKSGNWRVQQSIELPQQPIGDLVGEWLDGQDAPAPEKPVWSFAHRLFVDPKSGIGMVHYTYGFGPAVLDPESAQALDRCAGKPEVLRKLRRMALIR